MSLRTGENPLGEIGWVLPVGESAEREMGIQWRCGLHSLPKKARVTTDMSDSSSHGSVSRVDSAPLSRNPPDRVPL